MVDDVTIRFTFNFVWRALEEDDDMKFMFTFECATIYCGDIKHWCGICPTDMNLEYMYLYETMSSCRYAVK